MFLVGRAIVLKMKIDIKHAGNDSAEFVNKEANIFREHREPKMIVA
jgi:hypothetical protein